jgi:glucokinase
MLVAGDIGGTKTDLTLPSQRQKYTARTIPACRRL